VKSVRKLTEAVKDNDVRRKQKRNGLEKSFISKQEGFAADSTQKTARLQVRL
jgi:hypothetical protein